MPIFEFSCNSCDKEFEEIVNSRDTSINCPKCSSSDIRKLISSFSFTSAGGGGGGAKTSSSGGCSSCSSRNCSTCS